MITLSAKQSTDFTGFMVMVSMGLIIRYPIPTKGTTHPLIHIHLLVLFESYAIFSFELTAPLSFSCTLSTSNIEAVPCIGVPTKGVERQKSITTPALFYTLYGHCKHNNPFHSIIVEYTDLCKLNIIFFSGPSGIWTDGPKSTGGPPCPPLGPSGFLR